MRRGQIIRHEWIEAEKVKGIAKQCLVLPSYAGFISEKQKQKKKQRQKQKYAFFLLRERKLSKERNGQNTRRSFPLLHGFP